MESQIANEVAKTTLTWLGIIGSCASIIGVIASSLAATRAGKSKEAAEAASKKTKEIGNAIFTFQKLSSFDPMLALYETVKQMNIDGHNPHKLYPHIRASLIHFKGIISDDHVDNLSKIQEFISQLTQCEKIAGDAKVSGKNFNTTKISATLTHHTVEIQSIISEMRKHAGEKLR